MAQFFSDRAGIEFALPQVRGRFESVRITNQFVLNQTSERLDLFQVLVDVFTREAFGSLLGVYINIKKIGEYFQQVVMYGTKVKAGYEQFLEPRLRPPPQPFIFDFARSFDQSSSTGKKAIETFSR